jgi:hypothetical protein
MRATTFKKRFIIEQYATNKHRWYLYDNGAIVGRVVKTDDIHVIHFQKGVEPRDITSTDLSDLLCMLRQLDSL